MGKTRETGKIVSDNIVSVNINTDSVGIGTTNPTSKFHVVGNSLFDGIVTATTFSGTNIVGTSLSISGISTLGTVQISSGIVTASSGVVTYYGDGSKLTGIVASGGGSGGASGSGGSSGQIQYNNNNSGFGGASFFNYDNTRFRVGIGTSVPTARLSVASTATGNSLLIVNDNLSDGSIFRVNDNGANVLMDVDANGTVLFPSSVGTLSIGTYVAPTTLNFNVVGSAYISNSIGIGTTLPADKLTIFGRTQIQQDSNSNNRLVLRGTPGSLYRWSIDNYSSANQFRIFREDDVTASNGATLFQLDPSGNVLIAGITTIGLGSTSTPLNNSSMSFELTSNTNLRIKVKGTDGVLRSANITLS